MTDSSHSIPQTDNTSLEDILRELPEEYRSFGPLFDTHIRPALQAREAERLKAVRRATLCRWIAGAFILAGGAGWMLSGQFWALIVLGVLGIIVFIAGEASISQLAREAKSLIAVPIAEQFGLSFTISPGQVSSVHRHRELNLLPSWDRSSYEDLVTGERRGVNFELFEAHLEEKRTTTDSKGNTSTTWVTVFRGQCLRLDFHKTFYGRTLIARDAGFFNRFGGGRGMQRALLEDPVFERIFEVYTTDQVESRYLLTPDLMERLVTLERVFKGGKLKACFDGGEMLITLEGGNLFEPGSMFKPLHDPERIRELLLDFSAIFNIIDEVSAGRIRVDQNHS